MVRPSKITDRMTNRDEETPRGRSTRIKTTLEMNQCVIKATASRNGTSVRVCCLQHRLGEIFCEALDGGPWSERGLGGISGEWHNFIARRRVLDLYPEADVCIAPVIRRSKSLIYLERAQSL